MAQDSGFEGGRGFTIIEVLVVVAISAILSVVGFVSLSKYSIRQAVRSDTSDVAATVREAQRRAVAQQDGGGWGVRFDASSTPRQYEVFFGGAYSATSTRHTYSLGRGVSFTRPRGGTILDLSFTARTGTVPTSTFVSFARGGNGYVGEILVKSIGSILERFRMNMVGYWHFDEGGTATTTYDASGHGGHGTITAAIFQAPSACKAGACLDFSGSSQYVVVPHSSALDVGNSFSVAAWAKPDALSGTQEVVIKWASGNYWFLRWSGSTLQFTPNADEVSARVDYVGGAAGTWNHIAGTYDGTTARLYLNGASVASTTYAGGTNRNSGNLGIGAIVDGTPTQFFNGLIDEVQVYDRALATSEVEDLYNELK